MHVGNEAQIGWISWIGFEVLREGLGLEGLRFFVGMKGEIESRIGSGEAVRRKQRWNNRQSYFNTLVDRLTLHLFEAQPLLLPLLQATASLLLYFLPTSNPIFYNRNTF